MNADALAEFRRTKDRFFASSPQSPIDRQERAEFQGLNYFDHRADLVFTVPVEPGDGSEVVVGTSDGAERSYHRAGNVTIPIAAADVRLALYSTGHPGFFLPFRDATSGKATYGAGRYLDLAPHPDGTVTIDFNLAYNPFCAYTDGYSCALPPPENWLTVAVEAGERVYRAADRPHRTATKPHPRSV